MDRVASPPTLESQPQPGLPPPVPVLLSALLCAGAVAAIAWWLHNGPTGSEAQTKLEPQPPMFVGWSKPDVALLLSGEILGYLQQCGCSDPQKGGYARRYVFLESLKKKGWPVVAVDLGDLPQRGTPQSMLKYTTAMRALKLLDYTAVTFGEQEMAMPLIDALAEYALNNPSPRVVGSNLVGRGKNEVFDTMVHGWAVGGGKANTPRVGVLALVGPSVEKTNKDPGVKFEPDTKKVLRETLGELSQQQVELVVLLYQGSVQEATLCAKFCAAEHTNDAKFPRVDVILCQDTAEPAGVEKQVGNSIIVSVGHKGRYVGVVGANRPAKAGQPWQLRYQLVAIGPEYETPSGEDKTNPVIALMQEYADTVKNGNFLSKYPRQKHSIQLDYPTAQYVGATECKGCHPDAYKVWKDKAHSHAYDSLVMKAKRPSNRQFDGECIVCHVVGFNYETGFVNEKQSKHLRGVSCESCHGPASDHVANPEDMKLRALMNPHKAPPNETPKAKEERMNRINTSCVKCHDIDNDVHWNFAKNWPQVMHMTPAKGQKK